MVQSLDFVLFANHNPTDKARINEALSSKSECEIIVDRHRLSFDPESRSVTVDRASEDVPFAWKIARCRLPYGVLMRLLNNDWNDLSGFEWL